VLHPIFDIWNFEAVRFASQIFLHQSTSSYFFEFWYFEAVRFALQIFLHQSTSFYFFIFGTLKQSDLLCKSSCIKVLHFIPYF